MDRARDPAFGALLLAFWLASCGTGKDARPAVWSYVSAAITEPNCATSGCHGRATAASGLDFSTPDRGYASLTDSWIWIPESQGAAPQDCASPGGSIACQRASRSLVIPFDPAQSRLVQLLRGVAKPAMPPDRSLPSVDVALIETWIVNGGTDDRAARPLPPSDAGDDAADAGSGPDPFGPPQDQARP